MRAIKYCLCFTFAMLASIAGVHAQQFTFSGRITFERKENLHKQLSMGGSWSEEMKKRMPKYRTDQFALAFNRNQSLYKVTVEDEAVMATWGRVAGTNIVHTDFVAKKVVDEKIIYDQTYRVEDSVPAYTWKMLGEYRDIAGYNCRKAATIIMDSLYIIACGGTVKTDILIQKVHCPKLHRKLVLCKEFFYRGTRSE